MPLSWWDTEPLTQVMALRSIYHTRWLLRSYPYLCIKSSIYVLTSNRNRLKRFSSIREQSNWIKIMLTSSPLNRHSRQWLEVLSTNVPRSSKSGTQIKSLTDNGLGEFTTNQVSSVRWFDNSSSYPDRIKKSANNKGETLSISWHNKRL